MTGAELDELLRELQTDAAVDTGAAERVDRASLPMPPADFEAELDAWRAVNVRNHGRARADAGVWLVLGTWCARLYRIARARKQAALLRALEAVEEARRYEAAERRWTRLAAFVARRIRHERPALLEERGPIFPATPPADDIDF